MFERREECRITIVLFEKKKSFYNCVLTTLCCCLFTVHLNRIRNPNCWIEQMFQCIYICDGIISSRWRGLWSKPGDDIIVWQMWFGIFFNGGHSWSVHVQTRWKPLRHDHEGKSDSLQKEIFHRTFNQTLVWLRSGKIIVLWKRKRLTIPRHRYQGRFHC